MTDLKRSLRLADGLAMVVGMTVGAGIFRTPGIVAARLGRPGLTFVVWVLGAALAFLGALCFAELTTRQPRAAGKYASRTKAYLPAARGPGHQRRGDRRERRGRGGVRRAAARGA